MKRAKPITSPMGASTSLSKLFGSEFSDIILYRSIVGALQYLFINRPNIAFVISKVSYIIHDPRDIHWFAVKYLKSPINHGLLIRRCSSTQLYAYFDVDLVGRIDDCKSTSGYYVFFGSNFLSWSYKK